MAGVVDRVGDAPPLVAVPRERLDRRLDAATASMPLTLAIGPAGTGKTVLLGALARRTRVAWVTVRPEHADPALLERELAAADPGAALVAVDGLERGGPSAGRAVTALLDRPGARRVVVTSRSEPELGLPRRRIEGRVAELRAGDLAFTEDEAAALLRGAGLELRADQVARLVARTEGWAAGLRLAAIALRGGDDPDRFLDELAGDDWSFADYLLGEVLSAYDEAVREFLVRTSVVDQVCGELAGALTGRCDGGDLLRDLERTGCPIVRLDPHGRWFRYHTLLLELLRSRLRLEGPGVAGELHGRAAEWLVAHGREAGAVRHLAAVRAPGRVERLLAQRWLDLLLAPPPPESVLDAVGWPPADARVRVVAASACLDAGDPGGAARLLEPGGGGAKDVALVASVLRGRARGDVAATQAAARALEDHAHRGSGWRGDTQELRLLAHFHLGMTAFAAGRRRLAHPVLEAAAVLARELGLARLVADARARLAATELLDGRLDRAEHAARAAIAPGSNGEPPRGAAAWAYATLAACHLLRDEPDSAQVFADLGAAAACRARDDAAALAARAVRGQLRVAAGDGAEGARLLGLVAADAASRPLLARWLDAVGPVVPAEGAGPRTVLDRALERLAAGDALSAAERVEPLLDPSADAHLTLRVHAHVVAATARQAIGQPRLAEHALGGALELAAPQRLWHPFVVAGPPIRRHLERCAAVGPHAPAAAELLARIARASGRGDGPGEELTERERQVLRLLATLMTTAEIGAELSLSVNTIKTHTRNVYRKLGVSSRREALLRAGEFGLL